MIKNKINNKYYIGQTIELDVNTRWRKHKRNINMTTGSALYPAFKKYGLENFEFKIICICFDEACDDFEIYYISKFNSIAPNGYNLESGGKKNKIFHPDTCKKISMALSGKKHSEEKRLKNSISHRGKIWTEEQKRKMSESRKGKKFNLSDEQRLKRSERLKGHFTSDLTRQRVAEANKKRVWTDEMKQKIVKSCSKLYLKMCKKVAKYTLDNIYIESFNSIKEASQKCVVSTAYISKCCNNKSVKYKDFIWKFI